MKDLRLEYRPADHFCAVGLLRVRAAEGTDGFGIDVPAARDAHHVAVIPVEHGVSRVAQAMRLLNDGPEHRRGNAWRFRDRAENLRSGRVLLNCKPVLVRSLAECCGGRTRD